MRGGKGKYGGRHRALIFFTIPVKQPRGRAGSKNQGGTAQVGALTIERDNVALRRSWRAGARLAGLPRIATTRSAKPRARGAGKVKADASWTKHASSSAYPQAVCLIVTSRGVDRPEEEIRIPGIKKDRQNPLARAGPPSETRDRAIPFSDPWAGS